MHLITSTAPAPVDDFLDLAGLSLSVVFAEGALIDAVANRGSGSIPLSPPFHVSDEDAYLVISEDVGMEFAGVLADNDLELLSEVLGEGLLAIGAVARDAEGTVALHADAVVRPMALLGRLESPSQIPVGDRAYALETVNGLDHVQCTLGGEFFDEAGLDAVLRQPHYVGASWRAPEARKAELSGVSPVLVWSRHHQGRAIVEFALFSEDDELTAILRPALFAPTPSGGIIERQ